MKTGLADRDRLVHLAKPPGDPVPNHRRVVDKLRARDDFTEACAASAHDAEARAPTQEGTSAPGPKQDRRGN